jgi:hypothetical protein
MKYIGKMAETESLLSTCCTVLYGYDISGWRGLAVDQQGHVYISGLHSHDIHRLSPDGTFRDIVLREQDGVDEPWSITFNNDFTKLFIMKSTYVYMTLLIHSQSSPSSYVVSIYNVAI